MKWFISDTHFDHEHMKIRRDEDFQETILNGINSYVGKQDYLYILGDFAFKRPGYWRQQINCKHIWFMVGNHDLTEKCKRVFGGNYRECMETKICGHKTWLSHYAHAYWPSSHKGSFHLYGHCHDQREETLDSIWPERRSMEVSPETAYRLLGQYRPFADEEIFNILGKRQGHDLLEFYINNDRSKE